MPDATTREADRRPPRTAVLWLVWLGVLLAALAGAASFGGPQGPLLGLYGVVDMIVRAGWVVVLIAAASYGWGVLIQSVAVPGTAFRHELRAGLGLAVLFAAWHLAGIIGLLNPMVAWLTVAIGIVPCGAVLARLIRSDNPSAEVVRCPPGWAWVGLPGLAVLLAAACSPPGALWSSEFGGYDALSYHLPLPQAWLLDGRVWPFEHVVYSYLPSYMESGFAWIGALTLAPVAPTGDDPTAGLLADGGWRLISCHLLHAAMAVLTAWLVASFTRALVDRASPSAAGGSSLARRSASAVAGGLVLVTPWLVVVGSLAYNEMAVCALGAVALLAALDSNSTAWWRGLVAGLLVGVACGFKPTALFLVGPAVGLALLVMAPPRAWAGVIVIGSVAGCAMLAPWMVRNAAATGGNPVFPYAIDLTRAAHWSPDQFDRWDRAHAFDGSIADRLRLAVWTDPEAPAGAPDVVRYRGFANPQWGLVPVLAACALLLLMMRREDRRNGGLLLGMVATQIIAWLALTHLQSRFLIPCVLTLCPAVGLAADRVVGVFRAVHGARWLVPAGAAVIPAGVLVTIWAGERSGRPNELLLAGPSIFTGVGLPPLAEPSAEAFTNGLPGRSDRALLLLGDATPLYFAGPTIWSTTWDEDVLTETMRAQPEDPRAWVDALRDAGVGLVLVNFAEIDRLMRSGYAGEGVTVDRARQLGERLLPIRQWPGTGQVLFAVPPAEGSSAE